MWVTRLYAAGSLANHTQPIPMMIARKATTRARPRLAITTAVMMATKAAISPPRDSVAPRPITSTMHAAASRNRPKALRTPENSPAASAMEGTMPAAR